MAIACGVQLHRHIPVCPCGAAVGPEDYLRTADGRRYDICPTCLERARGSWRREKAQRIAALERAVAGIER